jgi:hypothetical protein
VRDWLRVWHIGAKMPLPGPQATTTPVQNQQGDESTSQAEYAGSMLIASSAARLWWTT